MWYTLQAVVFCLGAVGGLISMLINSHQPDPYMDEVFHIPQAQAYCRGNFSHWDPMITTLPGLYLFSVGWISPLSKLLGVSTDSLCVPSLLRSQNMACSLLLLLCLYWLHRRLHQTSSLLAALSSLNLTLFPVLFFFSFLYYTDIGATLLVMLGYALSLRGHHMTSAMVLLCAVCFRQTSIVWLMFVAGTAALEIIEPSFTTHTKGGYWMLSYPTAIVKSLLFNIPTLLLTLWPYLTVVLIFMTFVVLNGSLVVGDKSNHIACLHLPQLLYLSLFTCAFSSPYILLNGRQSLTLLYTLATQVRWAMVFVVMVLTGAAAVHQFTYAHPYLLADNRHYPFYLWKNVIRAHPAVRYLLLPVYTLACLTILHTLSKVKSFLWLLLFFACCFMTVVPQRLFEFRYYIIPYLMYRLHMPGNYSNRPLPLLAELLLYSGINAFTVYVFVYRPFLWPDSQTLQRFMW